VTTNLPIIGNYCIEPTGGAEINPINKRETTVCSGASTININVTKLEAMINKEISNQTELQFQVPNVCIMLEHKATMTELKECTVTFNGRDCPCDVCAEGAGVQLNCPTLIDEYVPEELDGALNSTMTCISANIFSPPGSAGGNPLTPFLELFKHQGLP